MKGFSSQDREEHIRLLGSTSYDLIVIGGGITGAGIALDAASRGLKTALVEKDDFASGTSSRSTKLIHGGLRYLKQLEFGLVKEVGSERAVVHNLAPHLVIPEKMLLPLSEKRGLGYWLTSIGLKVYDWLAGVKPEDQRRMLTRNQTLKAEPLLRKDDIKGGALYAEYRTDDARLTIEIIKTAANYGADILNYIRVTDFEYADGKIFGVQVTDTFTSNSFKISGRVVVSAAGPWVDDLREINKSKSGKQLHLTKGVHIVIPRSKLNVAQAIYFDVEDGRMIFAIPRGTVTYVGTTDTNYYDSKEEVRTTREDAEYLIKGINATFPSANLTIADIESSWAGLRPLIHEEGKSASALSRKDEIFESPTGLISIAGGKLTGYRKMAERVVNLVIKLHFDGKAVKPCFTHSIRLSGSFLDITEVKKYKQAVRSRLSSDSATTDYLVDNYGKQTDTIVATGKDILEAELQFCIANEMVCTLADFFVRRSGQLYFNLPKVITNYKHIADVMQRRLGWTDERKREETKALERLIIVATNFE